MTDIDLCDACDEYQEQAVMAAAAHCKVLCAAGLVFEHSEASAIDLLQASYRRVRADLEKLQE